MPCRKNRPFFWGYMYLQVHMYNYIYTAWIHNMVCKLNDLFMKFGSRRKVETSYNQVLVEVGVCIQNCILSNLGLFVWCHSYISLQNRHSKPRLLGYKTTTYLGLSLGFIWVLWMRKKERKESVPQTTVRILNLYNAFNGWVVQLEVSSLKLGTICSLHRYMKM